MNCRFKKGSVLADPFFILRSLFKFRQERRDFMTEFLGSVNNGVWPECSK